MSAPAPSSTDISSDNADASRPWRLDAALAYDVPVGEWSKTYRTRLGATLAAQWHLRVSSWGGRVTVTNSRTETSRTYDR